MAYAATLLKNSGKVWLEKNDNDRKVTDKSNETLFTSGKGKKRVLGKSIWNEEGMEYYDRALANWKPCYRKGSPDYKFLRDYWNTWIEEKGKELVICNKGMSKKSIHKILHTRKKETTSEDVAGRKKGTDDQPKKKYSYETDSDAESIVDQEEEEEDGDDVPEVGSSSDEDNKKGDDDNDDDDDDDDDDDADQRKVGKWARAAGTTTRSTATKAQEITKNTKMKTVASDIQKGIVTGRMKNAKVAANEAGNRSGRPERKKSKKNDEYEY